MTPTLAATADYEALADAYDVLTAGYAYSAWVRRLVALATRHGLRGDRALDVACGTGSTTRELVALGLTVEACDASPAMLAQARAKLGPGVPVHRADMRALPDLGRFDLVTCLGDAIDYMVSDADLAATMQGFARVLADRGVAVFDVNSARTYATAYRRTTVEEADGSVVIRRGLGKRAGPCYTMAIDLFRQERGVWRRSSSEHAQRHQSARRIARAARAAGLTVLARYGQRPGAEIRPDVDERHDSKVVYLLRKSFAGEQEGGLMHLRP
jgi:ubiquinone/menaquinone biosynthesis C-methylase UbiE